jgi:hypothetical protein
MSPAQEFYKLSMLYIDLYGEAGLAMGTSFAQLDRLRLNRRYDELSVAYLRPSHLYYERIYGDEGFECADWPMHLETLRNKLVLERLADV